MELDRRQFVSGSALAGLGVVGVAGLAGTQVAGADEAQKEGAALAKHTWEVKPDPIADIAEERDYDIVVVGAGMAGVATAEAAARNGASVVVVEKTEKCQYRGQDCAAINCRWQKENGIQIDPDLAANNLYTWTHQTANYDLIRAWAYNCGKVVDYLEELTSKRGCIVTYGQSATSKVGWDGEDTPELYREYASPVSFPYADLDYPMGGENLNDIMNGVSVSLSESAQENGAEFVFNAVAEQLVGDASTGITGVVATLEDGSHVQFNAAKGVVLATGDIGGNQEMIGAFCPIANRVGLKFYTPGGCNTGDGINMGVWAGAALQRTVAAPMIHQFCFGSFTFLLDSFMMSWLCVNRNGDRYASEMNFEPYVTNARMAQPGNVAWSVFDADWEKNMRIQWPTKCDEFIAQVKDGDQINQAIESGYCLTADTLEELAEQMGVPTDRLLATVESYNGMCDAGEDTQFQTPANYLAKVATAPFYAVPVSATLLVLPFGLHVDRNSQVCTEEDEPIEGLYAVGNVQGDFYAYDYPVHYPGLSHSRSLTFGQFVGEALATGQKITDIME